MDEMFGETIKEIVLWVGGMLVAAGITILSAIYVADRFIAPPDRNDALVIKTGLQPAQTANK